MKEFQNVYVVQLQQLIIIHLPIMKTETLYSIINDIRVSRVRLNRFPAQLTGNLSWTSEQQSQFYNLIINYGCDLNLIQSFFPSRTRKQIRRKYRDICHEKRAALRRQEIRRMRESRKAFFDEEILEQKLIKWKNKPNSQESSSSSDDN